MKFKNLKITAIVLAVLMVAGATTALAANAFALSAKADSGRGAAYDARFNRGNGNTMANDFGTQFSDENGNNQPVADGQVKQAGQLTPNADGTYTLAPNSDSLNGVATPFSFGDDRDIDGIIDGNFTANENAEAFGSIISSHSITDLQDMTLPTYTDAELAQIIADIESGKIKPFSPADYLKDGAVEVEAFFFDGENVTRFGE